MKHNHSTVERRTIFRATEFQPAFDEAYFALHALLVPPASPRPRRHQAHHRRALLTRLIRFLHPESDGLAARRVHPAHVAAPVLRQPVVCLAVVCGELGVSSTGAYVEREAKLAVQSLVRLRRCRLFVRTAAQRHAGEKGRSRHGAKK